MNISGNRVPQFGSALVELSSNKNARTQEKEPFHLKKMTLTRDHRQDIFARLDGGLMQEVGTSKFLAPDGLPSKLHLFGSPGNGEFARSQDVTVHDVDKVLQTTQFHSLEAPPPVAGIRKQWSTIKPVGSMQITIDRPNNPYRVQCSFGSGTV